MPRASVRSWPRRCRLSEMPCAARWPNCWADSGRTAATPCAACCARRVETGLEFRHPRNRNRDLAQNCLFREGYAGVKRRCATTSPPSTSCWRSSRPARSRAAPPRSIWRWRRRASACPTSKAASACSCSSGGRGASSRPRPAVRWCGISARCMPRSTPSKPRSWSSRAASRGICASRPTAARSPRRCRRTWWVFPRRTARSASAWKT
mmetsp:Transcript_59250/g.139726  ORF Transcript_59250/g.139726 Transcript_59250/m.139726 type:complete len:208 (+) Transcript_59250:709-1332(+)